jgi:DNA-binding NtrC family response regulator
LNNLDIKAKVLIIDDDADVRSAVRMTLELEPGVNYAFSEAGDVPTGLKALKSTDSDVVILDLHMPGEDGFDFIDKLEKAKSFPLAKVIILTADDSIKNLLKAEREGVNAYHFIGKPFASAELRALVLSLILPYGLA